MGNVTATKLSAGDAAAAFIGIYILDYNTKRSPKPAAQVIDLRLF
jgi:hypothetical protein